MLVKEDDKFEERLIDGFTSENISSSVNCKVKEEDDIDGVNSFCPNRKVNADSELLNKEQETENVVDEPIILENNSRLEEGRTVSVDYELLPEKFFEFQNVPLPLVLKEWLRRLNNKEVGLNNDEDSDEDCIPLVKLRYRLQNNKSRDALNSKLSQNSDALKILKPSSKKKKKNCKKAKTEQLKKVGNVTVERKRGRPRKSEKNITVFMADNKFTNEIDEVSKNEDDEFFWNSQSDSSNLDIPVLGVKYDTENDKKENKLSVINYREHDYFKSAGENISEGNGDKVDVKKQNKRKKFGIHGMKTDDKISFPCQDCGKTFSAASTLKNHLRIHNGTLIKCTVCHKGFMTKYLLKCHMRLHSGDLFRCPKCLKGFTTAELLKVHMRGHTGDRPFICNVCEKSFPCASNLSQHKQTHSLEKKFLCFQCGSSFSQKRCLDGHMLTHSEKNHICTVCGKLWARKSDLSEHMRVHTGIKPYSCKICPQKFTQASSLKRHQIVHANVKPVQCLICSKMFKCQQYYKRHIIKHEKEADCVLDDGKHILIS